MLAFSFAALAASGADVRPITIRDYRTLISISSPQFSPDETKVAFVRSIADFKTDHMIATIDIIDLASGRDTRLTDGQHPAGAPHWSPTGDRIAYISADRRGTDQVFISTLAGGPPVQLTHCRSGVQQFSWSPKGDRIAYVTPDDPGGNPSLDLFDLDDVGYLTDRRPVPSHLWTVPIAGHPAKRLTHGAWSVLENAAPFVGSPNDPTWSPDGKWIAFARQANPFNGVTDLSTIAAVNVATGEVRPLTSRTSYEYQPAFSARSPVVAFLAPHGPTPLSVMDVYISGLTGADYDLTGRLDRDVTAFVWAGKDLVVEANDGVGRKLWRHTQTGTDTPLDLGDLIPTDFDVTGDGKIAFVASTATTAPELYLVEHPGKAPHALTRYNHLFQQFSYGKVEEITWTGPDGEVSDGVLTYPVDYQPGAKVPLVVWSHGGPEAAAPAQFLGFEGDLLRQPLAGEGYAVFQPNYRGSDNLGNHHEHAIFKDPGEGPARDVMAGIEKLIQSGLVDPSRIAVCGHSYGGYMTSWLIGHDHRWRCAVVADGAVDWREAYNLSSDGNLAWTRDSLGGTPMDSPDLYRTGSPITYADQISTPTFIISGTADQTVPITESYELYHALKDRHVPVRFVGVPGAHHTPDSPTQKEQFYWLMATWIRKWNPSR